MAQEHTTDPAETTQNVESGDLASAQRKACLDEVIKNPGKTAAEIAKATGLDRHTPSRRLPELRLAGLVKNGPQRRCSTSHRQSLSWLPHKEGQE